MLSSEPTTRRRSGWPVLGAIAAAILIAAALLPAAASSAVRHRSAHAAHTAKTHKAKAHRKAKPKPKAHKAKPKAKAKGGAAAGASTLAAGEKIFKSTCGTCHTLAAAHTHGGVGPNLDQLKPSQATVANQVKSGGTFMPSFATELSSAQINEVAAFVFHSTHK